MKLVCTQTDLNTNLALAHHAVPSRPTHPVLANVLVRADADTGSVQITAFDLSLGIRTSFPAQVEQGGEIALPAKLLNDIVAKLPSGEITLNSEEEETLTTLTATTGQIYQIRGMNAAEFPELPEIESGKAIRLSVTSLEEGLRGTLFATSADETKQVLTGVHLRVSSTGLEFAATDGHRLAVVEAVNADEAEDDAPREIEGFEVTIPANALRELERMFGKRADGEFLSLQFEEGQVSFDLGGGQRLTSRTLEGSYPAYRQLIPQQFDNQLNVDRRELVSALERIAILADRKNNIVKFNIDSENQRLFLSAEAADIGSGQESMNVQISGQSLEVAFNVKYITESLKNLIASVVQIQLNTPTSPVVLMPLSGTKMTHLIMPVQIRN
jgi:DNA polymerase III subunit beta